MSLKGFAAKIWGRKVQKQLATIGQHPAENQQKVLTQILAKSNKTEYGKHIGLKAGMSPREFASTTIPTQYETIEPWVMRAVDGQENILWPGRPLYWAKTSGTTSGAKYIPISKDSISNHMNAARNALLNIATLRNDARYVDGKMIFLQGSPLMEKKNGVYVGRLSGIVAHHVPGYLQRNRMPTWDTNCIEDWETKVDKIVEETLKENMTLISGIPSWLQMYFEKLLDASGKSTITEIFPNLNLFAYGGVNYEPYRQRFERMLGRPVATLETYPASEGFIAFQDTIDARDGLLLNLADGIYYEFVEQSELEKDQPEKLNISQVEVGVPYAIILTTNAGLISYQIGDLVTFTSLKPPRIKVSGRVAHYTSAFGEHVIAQEVEQAIAKATSMLKIEVLEFHLAPQLAPNTGLPYHEWFVECEAITESATQKLAQQLDATLQQANPYYKDLINGKILQNAKVTVVRKGGFNQMMKDRGKFGGQNKVPKLANDRSVADLLSQYIMVS